MLAAVSHESYYVRHRSTQLAACYGVNDWDGQSSVGGGHLQLGWAIRLKEEIA